MDIDPKFLSTLIASEEEQKLLKRLEKKPLPIAPYNESGCIQLDKAKALAKRGLGARFSEKGKPRVKLTEFGRQMLWYLDMLKKVEVITALFPPCIACRRRDGTHTIMCPVGLGIIGREK